MSDQKHIEYMKQWRLDNRAKITAKYQEYMKARPEIFAVKTQCPCGGSYVYQAKRRHLTCQKHLRYLATINDANNSTNDANTDDANNINETINDTNNINKTK